VQHHTAVGALADVPPRIPADLLQQDEFALGTCLSFNDRLSHGILSPMLHEQLALAVAYTKSCDYCLAAHSAIGGMLGLTTSQLEAAHTGVSTDPKLAAAPGFAQQVV
jgi:AhpD family alkylhydroperoxidase